MVADLGCLGCAFKSGKVLVSFLYAIFVRQAVWGASYKLSDRTLSRPKHELRFLAARGGSDPLKPAGTGAAILRHGGVAPASDRVFAALRFPAFFHAFACSFFRLAFRLGEVGCEISSERPW